MGEVDEVVLAGDCLPGPECFRPCDESVDLMCFDDGWFAKHCHDAKAQY